MYIQGVDNVYDLNFNGREGDDKVTYGDVFLQAEQEYSRYNFESADTEMLFDQFRMAETACRKYLEDGWESERKHHLMALPAYDQCIKASHAFNLLDARGVISVTERQSYILRVRELAKACGAAWLETAGGGAWHRRRLDLSRRAAKRAFPQTGVRPAGWKARMWRSTGDFVQPMLRLDVPLMLTDIDDDMLHGLFQPFEARLGTLQLYLERGAGSPLPVPC